MSNEGHNVQGEISEHIVAQIDRGYCVYYSSCMLRNKRSLENWGISLGYSPVFSHVTCLDQSRASENI